MPYSRFKEVNERVKAAEQRWQQIQSQFGDLSQVDPNVYRTAMSLANQLQADPVAVATQLLSELAGHEQYGPAVISQAARVLQGRRGAAQPQEAPEPQPDLMAENGEAVYSARQLREWQAWNQQRQQAALDARLSEQLKPLKEITQERAVARIQQQAHQTADKMYSEAQQWHGFKEHEAKIAERWRAHPEWKTVEQAYINYFHSDILPTMSAKAQAQVVADLQQKAAANTLNPSGASKPAAPDFKGDIKAALEYYSKA